MTTFYLDTSVAVKILFGDSPSAQQWFDDAVASESDSVISSRLLQTELTRVLRAGRSRRARARSDPGLRRHHAP